MDETKPKRKKKKVKYLNNPDMMVEIIASKQAGEMTPKLANMLMMLTNNFGKRDNFANYSYNEDMKAYALMMLVRTWHKFDETQYSNPFAFYTQCIKSSFIQFLNQEKRQRQIRDEILVKKGLTPSFNYQLEYEENYGKMSDDHVDKHDPHDNEANQDSQKPEDEFLKF